MQCRKCGCELPEGANFCFSCGRAVNYTPTRKKRGNGTGTAIKRGKTWTGFSPGYSFLDENGKKHRVRPSKGGFATKKEALAWASSDMAKEKPLPQIIDLWQGYSENNMLKLSKNKQTAYKIARKRWESVMAKRIDLVTLDDLQAVINRECKTYYPAKDMKDLMSQLYQRAMTSNINKGRITQNLALFLVLPEPNEKEAVPFTEDEITKLWSYYQKGDTFTGYILLMCYTGMMTGELLKCKKNMVDLAACEIRGAGLKTKTREQASIAFPEFMTSVVADLLAITSDNSHAKNEKLVLMDKDNFYKRFYETLEKAGINNPVIIASDGREDHRLTPYSCRHTFGTEAVKKGFHPEVIKKMLRHSNTRTQEKYTHLGSSDVHDAVNKLKTS